MQDMQTLGKNPIYRRNILIDAEGSKLLCEVFNMMTMEQKNSVTPEYATRISLFMQENGYKLVFSRWYKQPDLPVSNAELAED